jgi:pyrroline-5-carboxylate reductase
MKERSIGFLGGGRVTRILLGGWQRAGRLPAEITVFDPDTKARERLARSLGAAVTTAGDAAPASRADLVVLAVHPPACEPALAALAAELRPTAVVLSLAPKVDMAQMEQALGGFSRLARMIPNAPSIVGAGYNPIAFGAGLPEAERREILGLFEPLGDCPLVAEEELEAFAVLSAMGPTYLWFQLTTLRDLGVEFGMAPEAASLATAKMALGAVAALFDGGLSEAEVMDLVPIRPLAGHEAAVTQAYRSVLPALYEKLASRHAMAAA